MGTTEKIIYILINSYLWEKQNFFANKFIWSEKEKYALFFLVACIPHRSCWISNVPCGYTLGNEKMSRIFAVFSTIFQYC